MTTQLQETPASVADSDRQPTCRFCAGPLRHTFVDLGMSPLCESYVPAERLAAEESFYPLHAKVCESCLLVQLEQFVTAAHIFEEYAYFSSYSDSWVEHARSYVDMAVERFGLDSGQHRDRAGEQRRVPAPARPRPRHPGARNRARRATSRRRRASAESRPLVQFFGRDLARRLAAEGRRADLLVANNVMAHVPDLNDFVGGMEPLLAPGGVVTIEVPHLLRLVEGNQFDTIYHEHFSYFSFLTGCKVLAAHGLEVFDVDELKSHGGSLRYYAQRAPISATRSARAWTELAERERALGYDTLEGHARSRRR